MSKTFSVSKWFMLHTLFHLGSSRFDELKKRLPAKVELTPEFVQEHALSMDWTTAMEKLLEGQHLIRALDQEDDAAEKLRLATRKLSEEFRAKPLTSQSSEEHEKALNKLWDDYSRTQAQIFMDAATKQGGWEIDRGRE